MTTRVPGRQWSGTPSPSRSMTPAGSWPGMTRSSGEGSVPSIKWTSERQIPHACTRTRTSPGTGSGSGTSWTWRRRLVESKTAARTGPTLARPEVLGQSMDGHKAPSDPKRESKDGSHPRGHSPPARRSPLGRAGGRVAEAIDAEYCRGVSAEPEIRTAELVAALCLATDLGMGFPFEHGLHTTLIGMRLAERLGVDRST